jgi:Protein of unknown function (DUF1501)
MNQFADHRDVQDRPLSRRVLLQSGLFGLGGLLTARALAVGRQQPHTTPKAKRMVLMFQHGGPSQIDLFDPKPLLEKHAGQPLPGGVEAFFDKKDSGKLLPSPFQFDRHGQSGLEFSELVPHLAGCADDLCMIRSLHTLVNDHEGAIRHFQTGKPQIGRPTVGAWLTYALGTLNDKLPSHVVLSDPNQDQLDGIRNWSSGFLPAIYQGTPLRPDGPALFDLELPAGVTPEMQRVQLSLLDQFNRQHQRRYPGLSELDARIANYAMAGQIRDEITTALDLSQETAETQALYGIGNPATGTYSRRCLMARRLLEHGVPYVALFNDVITGDPWDTHFNHNDRIRKVAANVDQPAAALIQDLKRTGLLDDTVVVWVGEFGRLPVAEGSDGRDHNRHAYTGLVAGGGFKAGYVHGKTDDFGYKIAEHPVAVGELHATLLQQFGLDHTALTYNHQGRDESLTDADITGVKPIAELVS